MISKKNIDVMLFRNLENRFNQSYSTFDLFEDTLSHLNAFRFISENELEEYSNYSPERFYCVIKKGLGVKFDKYGNIIGSKFTKTEPDGTNDYIDVTTDYTRYNKIPKGKLYGLHVSEINSSDTPFQTK
jgi:hypothetical protein